MSDKPSGESTPWGIPPESVIRYRLGESSLDYDRFKWGGLFVALDRLARIDKPAALAVDFDESIWGRTQYSPQYLAALAVDRWAGKKRIPLLRQYDRDARVYWVAVNRDRLANRR